MISLHVLPRDGAVSGALFKERYGRYTVALDGFVNEGPWFDPALPSQCFNHHEGVSRLETRATCAQVSMALRSGFLQTFRDENGPRVHAFVNDCDEDVCLSWWLLKHHDVATPLFHPLLNRLLYITDMLDTTAGAFPFPEDAPLLEEIAWVYEPYRRFRTSGGLARRDENEFRSIIQDVCARISAYVIGRGERLVPDTRFEVIGSYPVWSHVREIGSQARLGVFGSGIQAFVASSDYGPGRWMHVIGRSSEYIPFPVPELLEALNREEDGTYTWGGGSTIGGAPRVGGSRLSPEEVARVINDVMRAHV